jgi:hypothetical protein
MNQNYYNNKNVPSIVDNIMTNIDTYSNNNSDNYVPINNLTYNPNSFEPYGQSKISLQEGVEMPRQYMDIPNNSMYQNNMYQNNMYQNNIPQNSIPQNMDHSMNGKIRDHRRINNQIMDYKMMNNYNKKSNNIIKNIENMGEIDNQPLFSFNTLKKIVIYIILFIIFSHSKMTDIVCKIIPDSITMISNIPCISLKGLFMSIIIIILHRFELVV